MSLEYAIEYPCEMRRRHDEPVLRLLARTGSLVSRLIGRSVESGLTPSPESIEFTSRFSGEIESMEEIANFCRKSCPACLEPECRVEAVPQANEPIGCMGRIHYPIDARFERFLADRLQLICDTTQLGEWPRLVQVLTDPESPFDGEVTKELRRITTDEGLRFLELRLPINLARHASRVNTDCIFDILSGFGASDGGKSGYQRELPVIALSDYANFLGALLEENLDSDERTRISRQSASYGQYLRFLRAIRLAASLKVRVLLD